MGVALAVIAALFGLLLLLLALPVELRFAAARSRQQPLRKSLRLRWAFGLVDLPLGRREAREIRVREPRPKGRRRGKRRLRFGRLLADPRAWERGRVLLSRLLRAVHWRAVRVHATVGLEDPADTGRLWGVVGPLLALPLAPWSDIRIRPSFAGTELELDSTGELRLVPLQVVWVALRFALAPATWRVIRAAMAR